MQITDDDVARARAETPGTLEVAHLNNAGAALPPAAVTAAVVGHLELEARIGGYEAAAAADDAVEHTYDALAGLLGCDRDEVAVVENATRAWDMAFYGLRLGPGDRVLTGSTEYVSNVIAMLQAAARTGATVEVVDEDEAGGIDVADLARRIDGSVKLVALTHVPTHSGLVQPAAAVGAVARDAGVPFLLDACQSAGQLPLDVGELGCDFLSGTGRKFLRGPRGTGFLYVRRAALDLVEPPFLDLRAASWTAPDRYELRPDARRFENWEGNVAGKIGLGVAADAATGWGVARTADRIRGLGARLRSLLAEVPGVTVRDRGADLCGIVTFEVAGHPSAAVRAALAERRINVSVTPAAGAQFDLARRGVPDLVRASVHWYTTDEELDRLVAAVAAL